MFFLGGNFRLELPLLHIPLWGLSWLVRVGLIRKLEKSSSLLLRLSNLFDRFGSSDSAFHMELRGIGIDNHPKSISFNLTARWSLYSLYACHPHGKKTSKT